MVMSKLGKKVMSAIIAVAMVLPGVCCMQATVSAAENDPTVKMLGATISTDNDTGYQSIRAGIEVSNASNAGACGIKIKLKNGEGDYKIVSTEDEKYQKVYSKDTEADKVVYTVIVNKIPVAQAATEIEFVGFVKKLNDETGTEIETESIAKSVNGVVESIGDSIGKDVKILESGDYAGTLVYEYAKLDMTEAKNNLQDENTEGSYTAGNFIIGKDGARATSQYVTGVEDGPYYEITTCEKKVVDESKEDTERQKYNLSDFGKGIGYIHNGMSKLDSYIYSADIKADAGIKIALVPFWGWTDYNGCGYSGKAIDCNGEWKKVEIMKKENDETSDYFTTENLGSGKYCIKNFVIYKVVSESDIPDIAPPHTGWNEDKTEYTMDLSKNNVACNAGSNNTVFNKDGTIDVELDYHSSGLGIYLYLNPEHNEVDLSEYSKVVIDLNSDQAYPIYVSLRSKMTDPSNYWSNGSSNLAEKYTGCPVGNGQIELDNLNGNAESIFIKYNTYHADKDPVTDWEQNEIFAKFKIKSIKLIKK